MEAIQLSKLTDEEIIKTHLAEGDDLEPHMFPELATLSPAFFYQFTPVAKTPQAPEVVFVPVDKAKRHDLVAILSSWNWLWEAAQYRQEIFKHERYREHAPEVIAWMDTLPEANIYLAADSRTKYEAYAPLFHLLPRRVLERHHLPTFRRPLWPSNGTRYWNDRILPGDFVQRLSRAFAEHVWPYFDSGSGLRAFTSDDPLVLLSHSLDFWLPHAVAVIEDRMRQFPRVEIESEKQRRLLEKGKGIPNPVGTFDRPRMGGYLWQGEDEAAEVLDDIVSASDRNGQLRSIIEAIRSNRVIDDFSQHWSRAKEDFERKIYRKRAKVRVSFVELDDTLAVHSPRSEYTDNLLCQDFYALLDAKERHIIVCLRSGTTKLGDIATSLGYANHSPISKALAAIRKKAGTFLNLN
jgi:hypothetical protein